MIGEDGRRAAAHSSIINLEAPLTQGGVCGDPRPWVGDRARMPELGGGCATMADMTRAITWHPLSVNNVSSQPTYAFDVSLRKKEVANVGVGASNISKRSRRRNVRSFNWRSRRRGTTSRFIYEWVKLVYAVVRLPAKA